MRSNWSLRRASTLSLAILITFLIGQNLSLTYRQGDVLAEQVSMEQTAKRERAELLRNIGALETQVRTLGQEPVTTPVEAPDGVVYVPVPGPRGEKGDKGDTGARGERGLKGDPGRDGQPGRDGTNVTIPTIPPLLPPVTLPDLKGKKP